MTADTGAGKAGKNNTGVGGKPGDKQWWALQMGTVTEGWAGLHPAATSPNPCFFPCLLFLLSWY